jgi:hypothetical protein
MIVGGVVYKKKSSFIQFVKKFLSRKIYLLVQCTAVEVKFSLSLSFVTRFTWYAGQEGHFHVYKPYIYIYIYISLPEAGSKSAAVRSKIALRPLSVELRAWETFTHPAWWLQREILTRWIFFFEVLKIKRILFEWALMILTIVAVFCEESSK